MSEMAQFIRDSHHITPEEKQYRTWCRIAGYSPGQDGLEVWQAATAAVWNMFRLWDWNGKSLLEVVEEHRYAFSEPQGLLASTGTDLEKWLKERVDEATAMEQKRWQGCKDAIERDLKQYGVCVICDAGLGLSNHPFRHRGDCAYAAVTREEAGDK